MPGPLEVGRFDSRILDALRIRNAGSGYRPTLSELVIPVVQIPMPELEASPGVIERAFWWTTVQAAVAANFSLTQVFNPAASGMLVSIDQFELADFGLNLHSATVNDTALGGLDGRGARKDFQAITRDSAAEVRVVAAGLVPGLSITPWNINPNAANPPRAFVLTPPVVLRPGFGFIVESRVVNTLLRVNFSWRERPL